MPNKTNFFISYNSQDNDISSTTFYIIEEHSILSRKYSVQMIYYFLSMGTQSIVVFSFELQ